MMKSSKRYFFCGVGGSGMLPLAIIVNAQGHAVAGSDRALDQGRTSEKFDYLRSIGIELFAQDGSGVQFSDQILVASAAVEETVPDVATAKALGATRLSRAQLLASLFNGAPCRIGVGGTSGKSTTTAMIGWILHDVGGKPTIMNGAVMKNFVSPDALFASAVVGGGSVFVSEVDESDGSIAMFDPTISVLNNIALDHKTLEELRQLFGDFSNKAERVVLNLDNDETALIARSLSQKAITYSLEDSSADFLATQITPLRDGVSFSVRHNGDSGAVTLKMPGRHNVSNALAAIAAVSAQGVSLIDALGALNRFEGVKRRFEYVGERNGVTVIDDFGHNPDKIAATLRTLHDFPGRLLVMFQPHGFGPLRKMRDEFIECFAQNLNPEDYLLMPEPAYFGGTVDRSISSKDIAEGVRAANRRAEALPDRPACGARLQALAEPGDRIIIMGARDDTLSQFAGEVLENLSV